MSEVFSREDEPAVPALLRHFAPLEVELGDFQVCLRPLGVADRDRVRQGYALLSEESRMNRFWEKPGEMSQSRAESLTNTDSRNHVAWVVLPQEESAIPAYGAASFWRDSRDSSSAELAFTIGDPWQRKGFASLLFSILWFDGWRTGLRSFHGVSRRRNLAMASWWESVGGEVSEHGRQYELHLDLKEPQAFVDQIAFGITAGSRQVEVAEWMQLWLEIASGSADLGEGERDS
ncbi:GNAT family N-acetyltransferase [Verrucomicrobiales bacterium BCK34]|nr:GNAT family N-acetyltransferase [Verrucomicrobiales bacterium BCK34]